MIKTRSKFTILDEPFSHLMPIHLEKIKTLLTKEKVNKGFFITDHMYEAIVDISDNTYVFKGRKNIFNPFYSRHQKFGVCEVLGGDTH